MNGACDYTTTEWQKMSLYPDALFTGSVSHVGGKLDATRTCVNGACNYTTEWQKSGYTSASFTSPTLSGGRRFRRNICHNICYHTTKGLIDFIHKGLTPYIHRRKLRRDDRTDGIVSPYPDAHLPRTVSNSKRNQELHMRLTTNRQKMSTPMMLIGILGAHKA